VLDFANDADAIERAFADYYRTTVLSEETDPNKLHDLQSDLAGYTVYTPEHIDRFVGLYLGGVERDQLDPSSTSAPRSTSRTSTRTTRSASRAKPRRSPAPTASWRRSCPTRARAGRSCRSS